MSRQATILALLALIGRPALAQEQPEARPAGPLQMGVIAPRERLAGIPAEWRDSAYRAWRRAVPEIPDSVRRTALPGSTLTLRVRLLRNGDLYRVRTSGTSGSRVLDSILIQAVHQADEALTFPKFPPAVQGAGAEVEFFARIPALRPPGGPPVPSSAIARMPALDLPPLAPGCRDTIARSSGYRRATIVAELDSATGAGAGREWAGRVVQAIDEAWTDTTRLAIGGLPSVFNSAPPEPGNLVAGIRLVFSSTGTLAAASLRHSSGERAIDSLFLAAIQAAGAARAFPPPPSTFGDSAIVELEVSDRRPMLGSRFAIGTVELPQWFDLDPPQLIAPGQVRYPEELRSQRIGGPVEVIFVVGADGVPVPESFAVLRTPHVAFEPEVRRLVLSGRYRPGTIRGCEVPVLVRQMIQFNP